MAPISNQTDVENELELIRKCIDGDQVACSRLFYAYKELVYRAVYRLLGASDDTDDTVQQTFIELFKSLRWFEGKSRFSTWLYRIALNVTAQSLRKKGSRPRGITDRNSWADPETIADPAAAGRNGLLERREFQAQIYEALGELNLKKRTVLVLHDMEGRTMEEIAEIAGVPIGTIKSRLFHAREELKRKLQKTLDHDKS